MTLRHHFQPEDNVRLARVCGPLDAHLRRIEAGLGVSIARRGAQVSIDGPAGTEQRVLELLAELYREAGQRPIYEQEVELAVREAAASLQAQAPRGIADAVSDQPPAPAAAAGAATGAGVAGVETPVAGGTSLTVVPDIGAARARGGKPRGDASKPNGGAKPAAPAPAPAGNRKAGESAAAGADPGSAADADEPSPALPPAQAAAAVAAAAVATGAAEGSAAAPQLHTRRADLRGRTPNQVRYLQNMLSHDITFGIGPAGTGKTYLAVACAVDALERHSVQRLVLTRPAVEAGERLGFLPGDLAQKVDPYLRPLYDALYDLMGFDRVSKAFEKGLIEIAPLAFMRGRTLNHAFVILDEAQNTTREQMKMFLTRIGFGSRCVVTGDVSQIDLPAGARSGLVDAEQVLAQVPGIAFSRFSPADVVRHPLVARIVEAYDAARDRG